MDDNAGIFETHLLPLEHSSVVRGPLPATDDELGRAATPVRDDLRLVAALRNYRLPEPERSIARERVFAQLAGALAAPDVTAHAVGQRSSQPLDLTGRRARDSRRRFRAAAVIAALLAIGVLGGWQVSSAAAAANPDSPLYSVKRLEERVSLASAWSDSRRGEVLMNIADHRLSELLYESGRHDQPRLRALAGEYDSTMRSLINLTVTMRRQHEDTNAVLADLSHALDQESRALHYAQASDDLALSQALGLTISSQRDAIRAGNLDIVPPVSGAPPSQQSMPFGTTPSALPASRGASQPPPQHTAGAGQSGNGQIGGGNGGSGSNSTSQRGGSGSDSGNRTSGSTGGGQTGNGGNSYSSGSQSSANNGGNSQSSGSQSNNSQSGNRQAGSSGGTSTIGAGSGTSGGTREGAGNNRAGVKGSEVTASPRAAGGDSAAPRVAAPSSVAKPAAKSPDAEPEPTAHDAGR